MPDNVRYGPDNPHPLSTLRTELVWEPKRDEDWRPYDQPSRNVERQKDTLLDEISKRLGQRIDEQPLFTLR